MEKQGGRFVKVRIEEWAPLLAQDLREVPGGIERDAAEVTLHGKAPFARTARAGIVARRRRRRLDVGHEGAWMYETLYL
jgi:hypothetical protein